MHSDSHWSRSRAWISCSVLSWGIVTNTRCSFLSESPYLDVTNLVQCQVVEGLFLAELDLVEGHLLHRESQEFLKVLFRFPFLHGLLESGQLSGEVGRHDDQRIGLERLDSSSRCC